MQKKILFISYDGMTDPLGQSQVIPYLQGLSKKGFHFFLLSCEKAQAFAQNETAVKTRWGRPSRRAYCSGCAKVFLSPRREQVYSLL